MQNQQHSDYTLDPVKSLTKGYILALSIIAVMSLTIHIIMDRILVEQDIAATFVSRTSAQTTQIHRIVNLTTEYYYSKNNNVLYEMEQEVDALKHIHDSLLKYAREHSDGEAAGEMVQRIYFEQPNSLDTKISTFIMKTEDFVDQAKADGSIDAELYNYISRQSRGKLTESLNASLLLYENAFLSKVERLRLVQMGAVLIIAVTLMMEALTIFMPLVGRVRKYAERLHEISLTDMLTGIGNRRYFVRRTVQEMKRAARLNKDLCMCMVDIDHFKNINDKYGHAAGDYVLREVVEIMKSAIRLEDDVARVGGEEFVLLLPASDLESSLIVAERVRSRLEERPFVLPETGETLRITASFGLSQVDVSKQEDVEVVLGRADDALYNSKDNGRNKISYMRYSGDDIKEANVTVEVKSVEQEAEQKRSSNVSPIKPTK